MNFRTNRFPHAEVNPVSGNIYVAYNDKITGGSSDKSDIFLVQSTDGGATWSARVQVNDDATTTDQWFPNVVVSPAGDKIGIFYYSRQEDTATNNLFKYYGRIGSISGSTITFSPSVAISDIASFPEFGRDSAANRTYIGDYDQAYARAGSFDVVWSDNRSDLPSCVPRKDPNVYYQSVNITGTPTPTATASPTPTPSATASPTPTCPPIVVTGAITGSDPTQTGRLLHTTVPQTCPATTTCLSLDTTPRHYDSYTFTNTNGSTQCVTIDTNTACTGTNSIFPSAYLGSFDPANICTNWIGDSGSSPNPDRVFQVQVPAGQTLIVVVSEDTADAGCPSYTVTITGFCTTATPTATPSATFTPTPTPTPTAVRRMPTPRPAPTTPPPRP
jgi:hypothetical protein